MPEDARLAALELELKQAALKRRNDRVLVATIATALAGLLGFSNFYEVPRRIQAALPDNAVSELNQLVSDATADAAAVAALREQLPSINLAVLAARSICHGAFGVVAQHSLILAPLPSNSTDLDAECQRTVNQQWNAGGIAKGAYITQDCIPLDNRAYGGGYTSFVAEREFEENRQRYGSCGPANAYICCSPEFPG